MIFVTVGTHEQSFNRLIEEVDKLVLNKIINEKVIIQKGYSTYCPSFCETYDFLNYDDMVKFQKQARIIITHGAPASFIYSLSLGKPTIVVPRQFKFGEHVNDHQLIFSKKVSKKYGFPVIEDVSELGNCIRYCNEASNKFVSNNSRFVEELFSIMEDLFNEKEK